MVLASPESWLSTKNIDRGTYKLIMAANGNVIARYRLLSMKTYIPTRSQPFHFYGALIFLQCPRFPHHSRHKKEEVNLLILSLLLKCVRLAGALIKRRFGAVIIFQRCCSTSCVEITKWSLTQTLRKKMFRYITYITSTAVSVTMETSIQFGFNYCQTQSCWLLSAPWCLITSHAKLSIKPHRT